METADSKEAVMKQRFTEEQLGITRACGLIGISRSLYRYQARRSDDGELRDRLTTLAGQKRRYGYRRLHVLLCREGWRLNRKRTYQVYLDCGADGASA